MQETYTAEEIDRAVQQARAAAFEEAARIAEQTPNAKFEVGGYRVDAWPVLDEVARRIRAAGTGKGGQDV